MLSIESGKDSCVIVRNNIQRRIITETSDQETGLDNLIKKYELMGKQLVEIHETAEERAIILPLISKPAEVLQNEV
jgi:hypothetical protein